MTVMVMGLNPKNDDGDGDDKRDLLLMMISGGGEIGTRYTRMLFLPQISTTIGLN